MKISWSDPVSITHHKFTWHTKCTCISRKRAAAVSAGGREVSRWKIADASNDAYFMRYFTMKWKPPLSFLHRACHVNTLSDKCRELSFAFVIKKTANSRLPPISAKFLNYLDWVCGDIIERVIFRGINKIKVRLCGKLMLVTRTWFQLPY